VIRRALIVDVDGVVSPVHPLVPTWGDEVQSGVVFGPVLVSPTLCRRLDALAELPWVTAAWLTSWDEEMRSSMSPWPGRDWPVVAPPPVRSSGRGWWKRQALEQWLDARPEIAAVAWCDDHLAAPSRRAAIQRRLSRRNVESLLVAPTTEVGLTEGDIARLEAWMSPRE
jgi:hypothetical protein